MIPSALGFGFWPASPARRRPWLRHSPPERRPLVIRNLKTLGLAPVAFLLVSMVATVGLAVLAPSASAAAPPVFWEACPSGTLAGQCSAPRGVAADPTTGHLFVADQGIRRVDEFTAWGVFVKTWGWDVVASGPDNTAGGEFEVCVPARGDVCKAGVGGAGIGQFSGPQGIAIDSAGDVYVMDPPAAARRVQKFDPEAGPPGEEEYGVKFQLMFGGHVDTGGGTPSNPGNLCTAQFIANGDTCGAGTTGTANGEFGAVQVQGSYIAVDTAGTAMTADDKVYVGDVNRIQRFDAGGVWQENLAQAGNSVNSLAVDSAGNLYVTYIDVTINNNKANVHKLDPTTAAELCTLQVENPRAVATVANGDVYVFSKASAQILRFGPSCSASPALTAPVESFGSGLAVGSTGLGANLVSADGVDIYFANFSPALVRAYGAVPSKWAPPSTPPSIDSQYTTAVGTASAKVQAEINPHYWEDTSYYVEYGAGKCSEGGCPAKIGFPGTSLNAGIESSDLPTAEVLIPGLAAGTTYHYRFVAQSSGGGPVFGTAGPGAATFAAGGERAFTTYLPATAVADSRGYELVSPTSKADAEVGVPGNAGGLVDLSFARPEQAALGGGAITYTSFTAFADPQTAPAASQYLSRRGTSGWSTENITPPGQDSTLSDPLRGFTPELTFAAVGRREPALTPDAVTGFENLYRRDNQSGALRALTTQAPSGVSSEEFCVAYAGASADASHMILLATGPISPEAPAGAGSSLYEWSPSQGIKLVSVLPGETTAPPSSTNGFGAGGISGCGAGASVLHNAISRDGRRIFWTDGSSLFARVDGVETVQLDATQGGVGPGGGGRFRAASADGAKVFFTDSTLLTPASGPGDLYLYDIEAPGGSRLTDLTAGASGGGQVQGVIGAAEDGSRAYFVATSVLTGAEKNEQGAQAVAGEPNLYVWTAGGSVHYIATLTASGSYTDTLDWSGKPREQTARVSPNGRFLAFQSAKSLTGFDNTAGGRRSSCGVNPVFGTALGPQCPEAYVFDAGTGKLSCASCGPAGARPAGAASLPTWNSPFEQPRYLSDDGRAFFQTFDSLALKDTNGKQDVYEFEQPGVDSCSATSPAFNSSSGGCVYLISSGVSADESYFLDASANALDVFFSTRQQLVPADQDERFDVYDAREGGGFPPPPPAPPSCSGEACRPLQATPSESSPTSFSFVGPGNVKPRHRRHKGANRRCAKGGHRVHRHGKSACSKGHRKHGKRAGHDRRAAR